MGLIEWSLLGVAVSFVGRRVLLCGGRNRDPAAPHDRYPEDRIAAVVLNLIMRITGIEMPAERRLWIAFAGMGLLNNVVPFCLIAWGQIYIASGLASILNATTPFCTVLSWLIF